MSPVTGGGHVYAVWVLNEGGGVLCRSRDLLAAVLLRLPAPQLSPECFLYHTQLWWGFACSAAKVASVLAVTTGWVAAMGNLIPWL